MAQPASSGSTTYTYSGRDVTVTDPGGKWKKYRSDAFGQLIQVEEPNPGGGSLFTNYTFDAVGHLTQVSMPRGGTTQTRSWGYDGTTQRLMWMTQPETGTTTFAYYQERLYSKCEAGVNEQKYDYDAYGRVTTIWRGACGGAYDGNRTITFTYDAGEAWQENLKGRLAKISYKIGQGNTGGGTEPGEDWFSYTPAGLMTRKEFRMQRSGVWKGLSSYYGYDAEGRRTSMTYPTQGGVPALVLEYRYDALSRLQRVATQGGGTVWADNAQYGVAGELTSLAWNGWTENRTYNALGQLTRQTIAGTSDIEYVFSSSQNDGRITQRNDWITGEQVVYQYDSLARLVNATTGSTGPQWGYSYTLDGFGNLTRKDVTKGSVPTLLISVDAATNRINSSGYSYSANGNMTAAPGGWGYTFDPSNRMTYVTGPNGNEYYSYDAANKRVYRRKPDGSETIFFWSAAGELLGEFALSGTTLTGGTIDTQNIYFAGKLIRARNQGVVTDRLGSVTYRGSTRINYYPYGEEQPTVTAQDNFKYGTYFRDNTAGLDYAQNRHFSSTLARFQSADPYMAAGRPGDPARWNRYSYVGGDPVNRTDPPGLYWQDPPDPTRIASVPEWEVYLPTDIGWWGLGALPGDFGEISDWPYSEAQSPFCDYLREKIAGKIFGDAEDKGLLARFAEQIGAPLWSGPGTRAWLGHQERIRRVLGELGELVKDWIDSKCPGDPPYGSGDYVLAGPEKLDIANKNAHRERWGYSKYEVYFMFFVTLVVVTFAAPAMYPVLVFAL